MGQDTYIEATIYEKSIGKAVSEEWFTVLWSCHDTGKLMACAWKKLLSNYTDVSRLEEDCFAIFPQTALREMASCLFSYAVLPESTRYQYIWRDGFWDSENRGKVNDVPYKKESDGDSWVKWDERQWDEEVLMNKAILLRKFICELDRIHFENKYETLYVYPGDGLCEDGGYVFPDCFIKEKEDLLKFMENPQNYEWKFRFFDSH